MTQEQAQAYSDKHKTISLPLDSEEIGEVFVNNVDLEHLIEQLHDVRNYFYGELEMNESFDTIIVNVGKTSNKSNSLTFIHKHVETPEEFLNRVDVKIPEHILAEDFKVSDIGLDAPDLIITFKSNSTVKKIRYKNIVFEALELFKDYSDTLDLQKFFEKYIKNRYAYELL